MKWAVRVGLANVSVEDRLYIAKRVFRLLRKHEAGGLREAVAFGKHGKPLELWRAAAVNDVCDFLCSYGLRFQIYELHVVDFDQFKADHPVSAVACCA